MSFDTTEISVDLGNPIELYLFTYSDVVYAYTSSQYMQSYNNVTYYPEYIKRGESLKLGNVTESNSETCIITVSRNNPIALLYQGAPPEQDTVNVKVYRKHGDTDDAVCLLDGVVCQVRFSGSEAELTIVIEHILNKNIPRGKYSYYCTNVLGDCKCTVNLEKYAKQCTLKDRSGLRLYSDNLREEVDDYFTDGYIKIGESYRVIKKHVSNYIDLKYPINPADLQVGKFTAYPSCSQLFSYCHSKFKNTDHFSGVLYTQQYDVRWHPVTNNTSYWINSSIITRDTDGRILG